MSVTDPKWRGALVPLFLAAQILVVHTAASGEHPPPPPALARFPAAFGQWKLFRGDPIDSAIEKELGADRLVSQTYVGIRTASFASFLVAWFQTQREGARQPHSPKVCLPGVGWTPRVVDKVTVDTAAGAIRKPTRPYRKARTAYWKARYWL